MAQCPTCLPIRHSYSALSFKDSGFAIALPWRAANIWACLVSLSLPFLGLGLPLMFCYKRYWWPSGPSCLKWQQGSPTVAVETLSVYLMHIRTGICPLKSLSLVRVSVQIGKLLPLAFPERQSGSCWAPELLLRLGTAPQLICFLLFPWVDFLRGESF